MPIKIIDDNLLLQYLYENNEDRILEIDFVNYMKSFCNTKRGTAYYTINRFIKNNYLQPPEEGLKINKCLIKQILKRK